MSPDQIIDRLEEIVEALRLNKYEDPDAAADDLDALIDQI